VGMDDGLPTDRGGGVGGDGTTACRQQDSWGSKAQLVRWGMEKEAGLGLAVRIWMNISMAELAICKFSMMTMIVQIGYICHVMHVGFQRLLGPGIGHRLALWAVAVVLQAQAHNGWCVDIK